MSDLMLNKIIAAACLGGIIGMVPAVLAGELVKPRQLAEPVYKPAGLGETAAAAAPAEAAPAALEPIGPLLAAAAQNLAAGEDVFKKRCASCHGADKGGANKVGPNLYGIVDRAHAASAGFSYSAALVAMKDKPWTYEELNGFFANPKAYAPGTKMAFAGLKSANERASLIAWLRAQADAPAPLPQ